MLKTIPKETKLTGGFPTLGAEPESRLGSIEKHFLRNLRPHRPPAVILGSESCHGLAFVRSLGRKGIPLLSVGASMHPSMRTRFGTTIVQPCRAGGELALLDRLREIGKRLPVKGVMIACGDDYVLFLSRYRSELAPYYEFVIPAEDAVESLVSKKSQYEYARNSGIPVPKTIELSNDLETVAERLSYPCIVKPAYMHLWRAYQDRMGVRGKVKVLVTRSSQELVSYLPLITDSGLEWLAQELVEGGDDQLYSLYGYFDRDTRLLASFVRRKLRQHPPDFGGGAYSIGVKEQEIVDLSVKLLQPIRYRGLANIEFKRDARDGQFKLIEINVRCADQTGLAIDSGVDLPYVAYQDALGREVRPIPEYRQGVKWINLAADVSTFLEYRRRGQLGLRAWLASVMSSRSFAYFAWDDPLPAVSFTFMALRKLISLTVAKRHG